MESTREQVLHQMQARGGATVAELAEALDVSQASLRRHLDHLRADGLADVRVERHGVGRPAYIFYPTEQAEERTPAGYSRLLSRLYRELSSLDEEQVGGRDGPQVLDTLFEGVAQQVAREHRADVGAGSLEERVAQTSQTLQGEGIVDRWTAEPDGFHITNCACPYRQAAASTHGPCELDRRAIELLVEAPVRQVSRIVDGKPQCEYIVTATAERDEG